VDVGSGAGAPGVALAILRADLALTLVEPQQKRVAFLRAVAGTLSQRPLSVERARAEQLAGRSWQVAVSRATFEPAQWLELAAGFASQVWLLLARAEPPEVAGWLPVERVSYQWPLGGAPRQAVKYARKIP
jgi:16S rRNA (guanine527-N7)-methyltransferase